MALWIILVLIAQAINALVSLIDKFIVTSGKVGNPYILTFYISLLSSLTVFVFIFGWIPLPTLFSDKLTIPSFENVTWPTIEIIVLCLISAISFIVALVALFKSFQKADASDVVPVVASMNALITLLLSFFILKTPLADNFLLGFIFLVFGTFLMSRMRLNRQVLKLSLMSGLFFAIQIICMKVLFNVTNFDNAFFWSRMIISLTALSMLLLPNCCNRTIVQETRDVKKNKGGFSLIIGNKILAGLAAILLLKAVSLGPVAIVQALAGVQFIYLLMFSLLFGQKIPMYCGENCTATEEFAHKIISVSIITTGFLLLFI